MYASSTLESRHLARFRRPLSRSAWLFPRCCQSFSRFGCRFNRRWQFQLGLFRSAMMAMTQRLDPCGLLFCTQLSVSSFLALVLKVFRNRFRCHGQSVAELSKSKLSTFGHLVDNASTASKSWHAWRTLSVTRQRPNSAIIGPASSPGVRA
jgi:hypothetical protein